MLCKTVLFACLTIPLAAAEGELESARNRQDKDALARLAAELAAAAEGNPNDAAAQYRLALAQSYRAEVWIELRQKGQAGDAAEAGIRAARRAVELKPDVAEHHRILGTLCGQAIPANVLLAFKYGGCARDSVKRAIQLDANSARAYLSRGVGNYYLPPTFGGGVELAIGDFQKALQLDANLADAHLWLGLALRKANRNQEARQAFARALELNPDRIWAKQQLDKTPTQ